MPLVSVIIATYNRSQTLYCALKSILQQDFQDFEIHVVGDCCTDDSEEVVQSFKDPRIHWTNLPKRVGNQSGPNNEGLRQAKGKYIAYLGHDDLWFPWHLSTLLKTIEKGADFAYGLTVRIEPSRLPHSSGAPSPQGKYHYGPPSSWMHKKSIVDTIGPWRTDVENLSFLVDREFFIRTKNGGFSLQFSPHLTLIKFPSVAWKTYAMTKFPQKQMLQELLEDPQALHVKLLTQIAIESATHIHRDKSLLHIGVKKLIETYGRERWPINKLLNLYTRRNIKKRASKRGLI